MADESLSALNRRFNQLKRWEESETNRASHLPKEHPRKVKFHDGCVFLAACSSGDRDEVLQFLKKGADINTSNIDGLTALHQACIDDNLDMVEFLVKHSADVDVCDNEGWTPLHATASCGFTEIARYLIKEGANVAAVNNDGDLPIDICEDEVMEQMLQEEMRKLEIDADAARSEEENQMLEDANKWLNNKSVKEKRHQKTGATALHVAAAKGYMKVISVLLQAEVDINARDNDGWTPLHAAAHWCQEEACKALVEQMCDMDIKNNAGQAAIDVADSDIVKLLEELKAKQQSLKDKESDQNEIIPHKNQHGKRSRSDSTRSSVTRMSVDQKQNVILKNVEQERSTLEEANLTIKSSSSSASEGDSSESETEKQNELNKQSSEANQPRDRDKPPITAVVEIQKQPEMGKIEEANETVQESKEEDVINEADKETPRIEEISDTKESLKEKENAQKEAKEKQDTEQTERKSDEKSSVKKEKEFSRSISVPGKEKEPLSRSLSAPAKPATEIPTIAITPTVTDSKKEEDKQPEVPSWRTGLRKTGSTSAVLENNKDEADKKISRSLSSPRIPVERNSVDNDKSSIRRSLDTPDKPLERISAYSRNINNPYRSITSNSSSYQSAYVPYYRRQQEQNEQRERERDANKTTESTTQQPTTSAATSVSATLSSVTTATTTVSTVTSFSSCPNFVTNYSSRRLYEVPKRDEEAETQRKARAKRARETRRSTQGVTLEDIQKAEEVLHSTDTKPSDKSNNNVIPENDRTCNIEQPEPARRRYRTDDETRSSFRRSRDSKDSSSIYSTDSTSAYVPRRERNALSTSIDNKSSLGSSDIRRSASLRSSRLLTEDQDDIDSKKDSKGDDKDEKKGPSAIRARRNRRERRSTGIVAYDPSKDDDEDEKKDSEEKDKCSARKSAIEDKSEDMPAKKEESQRSLPRPAKKEESQRSLDRTSLMEEMGLRFRSAAKEQSEPTSDAKEQSAPTSATKGQTEPTVSWRSCGVPDQFKDMLSKARVLKKKCGATYSSYSKVPEKEHFVQDRDDDEGFLPLLTKHTEEVLQPSYNLTDFGIGSVIIPVKKGKSLVHRYNLEKLYALQEEDGSWKLTPELCLLLGIEYDTCMNILKDAGIKSLALKVQEEIIVLLATSLTLLFMIQQISPNWVSQHVLDQSWQEQLTKWLPNEMDHPIIFSLISGTKNKGTSQWSNMMTFYQQKEQEYKWTSYMLELGHCWALVAARMLALV